MLITDRQESVTLRTNQYGYSFSHLGKVHHFSKLNQIHEFFRDHTHLDSIKFTCNGQKNYAHFFDKEVEVYSTKNALRQALSQNSEGAWIEEKDGKKRYFVEEKGWLTTSYKEVTEKECIAPISTWQKVLGLGLGMLGIAPGLSELARQVPMSKEAAMGALGLQQRNPLGAFLTLSVLHEAEGVLIVNGTEFRLSDIELGPQFAPTSSGTSNGGFMGAWKEDRGSGPDIYGVNIDANGYPFPSEFHVVSNSINDTFTPRLTALSDGSGLVFWEKESQGGVRQVISQKIGVTNSLVGSPFLLNGNSTYSQTDPSGVELGNGRVATVWVGDGVDGSMHGIVGGIFDSFGAPLTNSFLINTETSGEQLHPRIAALTGNQLVTVWQSENKDGDGYAIIGQIVDQNGNKVGGEFQINTYFVGNQSKPSVATLENGEFVVAWQGTNQDGDSSGIFSQKFDASGNKIDSEIQVNTNIVGAQTDPVVCALTRDRWVIAWVSEGQDGDGKGIYVQMYSSTGGLIRQEILANTITVGSQEKPTLAALADGGFTIFWRGEDGVSSEILGQRFASNGRKIPLLSTEFQINVETVGLQNEVAVAGLEENAFVSAWTSGSSQDGDLSGVFARIAYWNESKLSPEFQVNFNTVNNQRSPSIAVLGTGDFEIYWESDDQDGYRLGVYKRKYDRSGNPLSGEQLVNTLTDGSEYDPSASSTADGGSVAAWTRFYASQYRVLGQRFNSFGVPVGNEFIIDTDNIPGFQSRPKVAGLSGGNIATVWESEEQFDTYSWDIVCNVLDSNGDVVSGEFQVNTNTDSDQRNPAIAALTTDQFVVVWQSFNQGGDNAHGVWGRRFFSDGSPASGEFHVNIYTSNSQDVPNVAGLDNGRFVVVWAGIDPSDSGYTIYGRLYNENVPLTDEFQIEDNAVFATQFPKVSAIPGGGFVVEWISIDQDQDGVFAKVFDNDANPLVPPFFVPVYQTEPSSFSSNQQSSQPLTNQGSNLPSGSRSESSFLSSNEMSAPPSTSPDQGSRTSNQPPTNRNSAGGDSTTPSIQHSDSTVDQNTPINSPPTASIGGSTSRNSETARAAPTGAMPPEDSSSEGRENDLPGWAWLIIGVVSTASLGVLAFLGYKRKKKKKDVEKGHKMTLLNQPVPSIPIIDSSPSKKVTKIRKSSIENSSNSLESGGTHVKVVNPGRNQAIPRPSLHHKTIGPEEEGKQHYKVLELIGETEGDELYEQTGFVTQFKDDEKFVDVTLGQGNFGDPVRIAREVGGKRRYVAMKRVEGNGEEMTVEGAIHKKLSGKPNIIALYNEYQSENEVYHFTQLGGFGGGDKLITVRDNDLEPKLGLGVLSEANQKLVMNDLAKGFLTGVIAMHKKNIYHLDLKLGNIVFDKTGELYIIDFGHAKKIRDGNLKKWKDGTLETFSPERIEKTREETVENKKCDPIAAEKIDAWAVGAALLSLIRERDVFAIYQEELINANNDITMAFLLRTSEYYQQIVDAELEDLPVGKELKAVIQGLLEVKPEDRLTPEKALEKLPEDPDYTKAKRRRDFMKMKGTPISQKTNK